MAFQAQSEENSEMSEINVTPLVDVMLVLLVVFIVTAPLLTQIVLVKLPKTEQTEPGLDQHITILSIAASGQPMINDKLVPLDKLELELKALQKKTPTSACNCKSIKPRCSMPLLR